jgi:hypothetical protein
MKQLRYPVLVIAALTCAITLAIAGSAVSAGQRGKASAAGKDCCAKAGASATAAGASQCTAEMQAQCTAEMRAQCAKNGTAAAAAGGCPYAGTATAGASGCSMHGATTAAAAASECAAHAKGATATAANNGCCAMSGTAATAAACEGAKGAAASGSCAMHGTMAAAAGKCDMKGAMAHAGGCVVCTDETACDDEMRGLNAHAQVVGLRNGAMIVYTAESPENIRALQVALARHNERVMHALASDTESDLCGGCKSFRGAMASGKFEREVVNVKSGAQVLLTSTDRSIVRRIHEMTGAQAAARTKS